jgi:ELWxxDGT repeat protein
MLYAEVLVRRYPDSSSLTLTNFNGTLYFRAVDGVHGSELWKSDGAAAGTVLVLDIKAGSGHSYPRYLTNVNGTLYFKALTDANGRELWILDTSPTGLFLSSASIVENNAPNATVGTLSTTDPDSGSTFTFSLVAGAGSPDNASFAIIRNTLTILSPEGTLFVTMRAFFGAIDLTQPALAS